MVSKQESASEITPTLEERLKGIAYQFVTLYDRWREDRQLAANKDAEIAKLAEEFSTQLQKFEKLGVSLEAKLSQTIDEVLTETGKRSVAEIKTEAQKVLATATDKLNATVEDTQKVLDDCKERAKKDWYIMAVAMWFTAILVGVCLGIIVVKRLMPDPVLPLTDSQIEELHAGRILGAIWPKMMAKEKAKLKKLAIEVAKKQPGLILGNN